MQSIHWWFWFFNCGHFWKAKPKSRLLGVTAEGKLAHLRVTRRSAVPLFTSAGDITDASRWIRMPKTAGDGRQIGSIRNFLICSFLPTPLRRVLFHLLPVLSCRPVISRVEHAFCRQTDRQIPAAVKMQPRLIHQESLLFVRASSGGAAELCSCLLIKKKTKNCSLHSI